MFVHDIKTNAKSPLELKTSINLLVSTNASSNPDLEPTQEIYELRRGRNIIKNIIPESVKKRENDFSTLINRFLNLRKSWPN